MCKFSSLILHQTRQKCTCISDFFSNLLNLVIQHIGKVMNPEEDILFLYLTSHGSKENGLSVEFIPLQLNMIDPKSPKRNAKQFWD